MGSCTGGMTGDGTGGTRAGEAGGAGRAGGGPGGAGGPPSAMFTYIMCS